MFHVHSFVGIFVNGQQYALPDGIGFAEPLGDTTFYDPASGDHLQYWENYAGHNHYGNPCIYRMHTHDATGVIHQEDPSNTPITSSMFTLGQFFGVWGIAVSGTNFGPYQGIVTVYWNGPGPHGPCSSQVAGSCEVAPSQLQIYSGDPNAIPLYSHTVVWFEVGTGNPDQAHLPGVNFFERQ